MEIIKDWVMIVLFYLFRVFPVSANKIVICSYLGRGYGGEGKAVCEKLLGKGYDIIWLVRDMSEVFPEGIRKVKYLSLRSIYEQATAKVWLDNRRKPYYVRKRRGQYYLMVWHGDICIKHVEKDAADQMSKLYVKSAKNDSRMADAFLAGTQWRKANFRSAFWYDGEILEGDLYRAYHLPENRRPYIDNVYDQLKIEKTRKIVTYAPTFRKNRGTECYNIDYDRLLDTLEARFGGKWTVAVRLHPNIADKSDTMAYTDRIINASYYPQINDLILASDLLITDYSGCMFEGYRAGKMVMIYASDYDDYIAHDRGSYFRFEDLPAPIAHNNDELAEAITAFDPETYEKERNELVNRIGYYDRDGAEVAAGWIDQKISGSRTGR